MNDQLQAALAALLNKTIAGIDAGQQFLSTQLPDVINQLLVWNAVLSLVYFVIGAALFVATFMTILAIHRNREWWDGYERPPASMVMVFTGLIGFLISVPILTNDLEWLQIWLAPKVYLIEYAAHLAK